MQIHQSFIKAAQKGVFHGDGLLECTSSAVSLGYGWLPCRALGYWKVTYATKRGVMLDFGQTLSLAAWKRMKPPPRPRHHHPRKWSEKGWHLLHSPSLFWSSKKKNPLQKQNTVMALPKIGIWPSWGVQEPGAAVQYNMASWEWELKITTRWLMILRAIVKLSSCDINQSTNISTVRGRKSPWRCTPGIYHYWVARHDLGVEHFSCALYPFGKPAFSSVRWHNRDGFHEVLGGIICPP